MPHPPPVHYLTPGPSQPWPGLDGWLHEAHATGVLSLYHRTPRFRSLYQTVAEGLRIKLGLPPSYAVLFLGSATEAWSCLADGLAPAQTWHLSSGAFGERWHAHTAPLVGAARLQPLAWAQPFAQQLPDPLPLGPDDLLALTTNETSTGTAWPPQALAHLHQATPALLAWDATSALAMDALPLPAADAVFASVQKGFGLPAGLAVLLLSPRAQERVRQVGRRLRHNALLNLLERAQQHETAFTPNVLGIYLMGRVLQAMPPVATTHQRLEARAQAAYQLLDAHPHLQPLPHLHPTNRSRTVVALQGAPHHLAALDDALAQANLVPGPGYGPLKATTRRLANFPALPDDAWHHALEVLANFRS